LEFRLGSFLPMAHFVNYTCCTNNLKINYFNYFVEISFRGTCDHRSSGTVRLVDRE
jgi:hypothetical protein